MSAKYYSKQQQKLDCMKYSETNKLDKKSYCEEGGNLNPKFGFDWKLLY